MFQNYSLIISSVLMALIGEITPNSIMCSESFLIKTTWDNEPVNHEATNIVLQPGDKSLIIDIKATFFNSPPKPNKTIGEDFNLYDYEVVEAFFLNDAGEYLELEFGPFGHYLVLTLDGVRQVVKRGIKVDDYKAYINGCVWSGRAVIPDSFFPYKVTKWNAYAIHGEDKNRMYESLFPVCKGRFENPDFHRLEPFSPIDFSKLVPENHKRNTNDPKYWSRNENQ